MQTDAASEAKQARLPAASTDGQAVLISVVTTLLIIGMGVASRSDGARQANGVAIRFLAGRCAMTGARRAMDESISRIARWLSDPAHGHYREIRRRLIAADGPEVDLSDLLGNSPAASLFWNPVAHPHPNSTDTMRDVRMELLKTDVAPAGMQDLGNVQVLEASARVERLGTLRIAASEGAALCPDERVGVLRNEVLASANVGNVNARRRLVEYREIRVLVSGPPRPFDQIGLYVGDISAVTDPVEAGRLREKVVTMVDETASALDAILATSARTVRLEQIRSGWPAQFDREETVPRMPDSAAVLYGPLDTEGPIHLKSLDLAGNLQHDMGQVERARREFTAALRAAPAGDPLTLAGAAEKMAKALNQAVMRIWEFHRVFRVVPRADPEFAESFGSFESRLEPKWFDSSTLLRLQPDSSLWRDWISGRRELNGCFHVHSPDAIDITGTLSGRTVLVVDAPAIHLHDVPEPSGRSLLTVVAHRGTVRLTGVVHAAVIVARGARPELSADLKLKGALLLPEGRSRTAWSGTLENSHSTAAGDRLPEALELPARGAYSVALSPAPVWTEGDRQ